MKHKTIEEIMSEIERKVEDIALNNGKPMYVILGYYAFLMVKEWREVIRIHSAVLGATEYYISVSIDYRIDDKTILSKDEPTHLKMICSFTDDYQIDVWRQFIP